jgi:hypothetical protein
MASFIEGFQVGVVVSGTHYIGRNFPGLLTAKARVKESPTQSINYFEQRQMLIKGKAQGLKGTASPDKNRLKVVLFSRAWYGHETLSI